MSELLLKRVVETEDATYGVLFLGLKPSFVTLELPDRENKRNISRIPAGTYRITKYSGTKFPDSFWVHDVPNRSSILIHVGNYPSDTQGCILVGSKFGVAKNKASIQDSKYAMLVLNRLLPFETKLTIKDCENV